MSQQTIAIKYGPFVEPPWANPNLSTAALSGVVVDLYHADGTIGGPGTSSAKIANTVVGGGTYTGVTNKSGTVTIQTPYPLLNWHLRATFPDGRQITQLIVQHK